MSTLAFSLHRRVLDRKEVSTSKDTGPSQFEERPDGLGHEGALAFKRHAIAVYNGYMGATVLIGSSYMFLVWIYFQCTNCKGTMTLLTRKHVVVIGGSSGIGLCVAELASPRCAGGHETSTASTRRYVLTRKRLAT